MCGEACWCIKALIRRAKRKSRIETVDDAIARVTADAAYDTVAFYAAAEMRDATVVVPPSKTARVSRRRPRSRARDRTITDVRTLGRRRWTVVVPEDREGVSASAAVSQITDVRTLGRRRWRPATSSRRGWRMRSFGTNRFSGIGFAPGPEAGEWPSPWSRVTS